MSSMQPLAISHYSIVNSLGAGARHVGAALRGKRSGLKPCDFESVELDTYIGRVAGLESLPVRSDLAAHDCRNNRLAQLGLELDGFSGAASAARSEERRVGKECRL